MDDLSKIMRMFINRGIVDNVRILKEETVDFMYQIHWFGYGEGNDYRAKGLQMKVMNNFEDQGIVFRGHQFLKEEIHGFSYNQHNTHR